MPDRTPDGPTADGPRPDGITPYGVTPHYTVPVQPIAKRWPPALVWVVCGVLVFLAAIAALGLAATVVLMRNGADGATALGAMLVVQLIVYLVVAIFVFRGKSWARWTGIVVAGSLIVLSVIVSVIFRMVPNCLGLLVQFVIIGLLLRKEVADWCYPH